ncbi:MAG: hypothetical protein RIE56_09895 [Amphiplicatus sp.]
MENQTPVRAGIVAFVALAALAAAMAFVAGMRGSDLGGVLSLALMRLEGASLLCGLVVWGALLAGLVSVITFYGAFSEQEDRHARRRFPKGLPALLFIVSLGLLWLAFACASLQPAPEPEPPRVEEIVEPPLQEPPAPSVEEIVAPAETPPPEITARALPMRWIYAEPLVFNGDWRASPEAKDQLADLFPLSDPDGSVRALLCDKAGVALAGAASQEGPPVRTDLRARLRAQLAAGAAEQWLSVQGPDCTRPVLLGLDLGQHEASLVAPDPSQSAGQRQALIVTRARASVDERVSADQAVSEMTAFYADPSARAALLGARRYRRDPVVFVAADPR